MYYFVTFEAMERDIGLIEEVTTHIAVDANGDIGAAIRDEVRKLRPHGKVMSYELDQEEDDIQIIADYFC